MVSPVKSTKKAPKPEGVVAGGTATFRIPVGYRIHSLMLAYAYNVTTQNVADFTEIRLFANDKLFQRFSGTQRDTLNQYDGKAASVGILPIPFDRDGLLTVAGKEDTALNTGAGTADEQGRAITSMYMEIDLDSGMTIAASDLTLYLKVSEAIPKAGPGTIPFIRSEQRSPAGADTDYQIGDLVNPGVNAPEKVALSRITFIPSTGTVANLKLARNGYDLFDRTDALNRAMQSNGVRSPQSGYYTIDTTEDGHGGELVELYGLTDYRYHLDVSAAMTLTCLSEYHGVLA